MKRDCAAYGAFNFHAIVTNCSASFSFVRKTPQTAVFCEADKLNQPWTGFFAAAQARLMFHLNRLHQVEFPRRRQTSSRKFYDRF